MTERSVLFATPGRNGWVSMEYLSLIIQSVPLLMSRGVRPLVSALGGNFFIDNARNRISTDFLRSPGRLDELFFIDDDVGTNQVEKIWEFLERPEDVVCGSPPLKRDPASPEDAKRPRFPVGLRLDEGKIVQHDGLVSIEKGPTGFMRIKRRVLETMAETTPTYFDENPDGSLAELYQFFKAGPREATHRGKTIMLWHGEDISFLKDWRALGGTAWIDPDIMFTHRGEKVWSGRFADEFKQTPVRTS